MNSLGQYTSIDLLVDDDSYGALIHIENNSSTTMVVLEWHALVHGRIYLDINIISSLWFAKMQDRIRGQFSH